MRYTIKSFFKNYNILFYFILWLIFIYLVSFLASIFVDFHPTFPYSENLLIKSGLPKFIWSFANFDGVHYLNIARVGYAYQYTQVFFPLYPLLIRYLHQVLPFFNYIINALVISLIAFYLSLHFFYKLLLMDFEIKKAKKIIIILLIFPISFYFASVYTESIFFLFTILTFYFARKKNYLISSFFCSLATATRLVGIFLIPAILYEYLIYKKINFKKLSEFDVKEVNKFFLSLIKSPILYLSSLGVIIYLIYLYIKFNDPLLFWHDQPVFGAERSGNSLIFLPQVIYRYIKIFFTVSINTYKYFISASEFITTILTLTCLIHAYVLKVRISYMIFSWLAFIIPTLTGTFSSMPRYILIIFPIYIVLSYMNNKIIYAIFSFASICLLILYTILFTSGYWVA
jgi:Gpi18-like mannosyltransferase